MVMNRFGKATTFGSPRKPRTHSYSCGWFSCVFIPGKQTTRRNATGSKNFVPGLVVAAKHHHAHHIGTRVLHHFPVASRNLRVSHKYISCKIAFTGYEVSIVELVRQTALIQKERQICMFRIYADTGQDFPSPRIADAENSVGAAFVQLTKARISKHSQRIQDRPGRAVLWPLSISKISHWKHFEVPSIPRGTRWRTRCPCY